jgi:hypothetical protein
VSDGARFEPQRDAAMSACTRFDVFDNQRRLFVVVDVETRLFTCSPRTSTLIFVHAPGTRSTYASYLLGVSFRSRDQGHSGSEMY